MTEKINVSDLEKSLAALKNELSKGHNSRGTNTTAVESMRDGGVGAGSSAGATQVFHTPNNSDPGTWAGTSQSKIDNNGDTDLVDENGTDLKAVMSKVRKGQVLTAEEVAFLEKAMGGLFGKEADDDSDEDEEESKDGEKPAFKAKKAKKANAKDCDPKDMEKSLADLASEDEDVAKGLEVSEFLEGFVRQISKSLDLMEERICRRVESRIETAQARSEAVQKSLAGAVAEIGQVTVLTAQRMDQVESGPARAPLAVQNVEAIEKSQATAKTLTKSLVMPILEDLVIKGQASAHEVIKYESVGELSPALKDKVLRAINNA